MHKGARESSSVTSAKTYEPIECNVGRGGANYNRLVTEADSLFSINR